MKRVINEDLAKTKCRLCSNAVYERWSGRYDCWDETGKNNADGKNCIDGVKATCLAQVCGRANTYSSEK